MSQHEDVIQILKKEYGIASMDELNRAIRKLDVVDIFIFSKKAEKKKEEIGYEE